MKTSRSPFLLAVFALLAVCQLPAQTTFDLVAIIKGRRFVKTASSGTVADTSNVNGNLDFAVTVSGPSFGSGIAAPVVTLGSGSTYPTANSAVHNGGSLIFNSDGEWGYGFPDGQNIAMSGSQNVLF